LNYRKREVAINDFIDYDVGMASVTIRKLPDEVKEKLRVDAARRGISLEAYARKILGEASGEGGFRSGNLVELARECFGKGNGVDLELPGRGSGRELVAFD